MERTPDFFRAADRDNLPGFLDILPVEIGRDHAVLEMPIRPDHLNLLGSVHGGSVVALADTAAGYGTYANLPDGAEGFATIELKCNFIRATGDGTLNCRAKCVHQGKTTQVWDATVFEKAGGRKIAEFRCTQIILYPK